MNEKQLIVFDFDETIVNCNSDTWIHKLGPNGTVPQNIIWKPGQDYFQHVQNLLIYLHSQGIREQDYYESLKNMPPVDGIIESLIKVLGARPENFEIIVLSDANKYFIDAFLKANSIDHLVTRVLTNGGTFDKDGVLRLIEYHNQTSCPLSPRNLCKGLALKEYLNHRLIEKNIVFSRVHYVGDGENDLCPCSKLSSKDTIFPRQGFPLHRLCEKLKKNAELNISKQDEINPILKVDATVVPWANGKEICNSILGKITVIV